MRIVVWRPFQAARNLLYEWVTIAMPVLITPSIRACLLAAVSLPRGTDTASPARQGYGRQSIALI